jgi:maltose alpha-D-glucosyltransferase/alpha-amylase
VHRADDGTGTMVFVHNLSDQDATLDLSTLAPEADFPNDVLADQEYPEVGEFKEVQVAGYGYRWIRLCRHS